MVLNRSFARGHRRVAGAFQARRRSGPAVDALADPLEAELIAEGQERTARHPVPGEGGEIAADLCIPTQRGEPAVEEGIGLLLAERGGQLRRVAQWDLPVQGGGRDRLDVLEALEH